MDLGEKNESPNETFYFKFTVCTSISYLIILCKRFFGEKSW